MRDGNDITYTVDDLTNRYTSVADANLTYDAAGDLTKDKDGYEYEYDYESRIIRITRDPNDTVVAEYSYDALGRRIEKKDLIDPNNTTRYYYNNNWQVLCEYDGAGSYKKLFVYGNYIDEVLYTQGTSPPSRRYYVHDHLYSPVALVYATGTVLERYEYDAYGNCYVLEPNFAPDSDGQSNSGNPYLFTGRRVDILDSGSLKIQYNRNRYYDYYSGRWLTHDPLGMLPNSKALNYFKPVIQYSQGMNLYEYVSSTPIIGIDPWGLKEEEESPTYQINGPVPPWPDYPDVPSAPPWLPEPPGLRTAEHVLYALSISWALLGDYDAAYFLWHWLDATGWPVLVDYRRILNDSYGARAAFMTELKQAQAAAEALVTGSESGPTQITSISRDTYGTISMSDDFNWYAAIGSHYVWGRAHVEKGKKRKNCCYYMDISIRMCDQFDFDIREIQDVLVIPAWLLEYYGHAESFRSAGKNNISVTWIKGYRWEHDSPRSIIQGIQKPVPQCE
ncbi:MAG: RHS repeat-associated core domain-containing protein [Sedimentisphaerales bacterium]